MLTFLDCPRARIALCLVCCATAVAAVQATGPRQAQPLDKVTLALEQYRRGEFDEAVRVLIGSQKISSILNDFRGKGGQWIDRAAAAERQSRTLVASAMAVELMAASFRQDVIEYAAVRDLIDWSCKRLSKFPPVDAERWIHLGFISLAEGARDDSVLTGVTIHIGSLLPATGGPHAEHAGVRFPREGRFKLAHVTSVWQAQMIATFPLPPDYLYAGGAGRFSINDLGTRQFDVTLQLFAALFNDAGVGAEARLRSGVLKFLRENPDGAKVDLEFVATGADPAVRSLSHLMLGAIADRAGDHTESLRQFRLAYETVPSSASSVALAARLFRSGRTEEALNIQRTFEAAPPGPDPWNLYGQRDFRFFAAYQEQMRKAVAR